MKPTKPTKLFESKPQAKALNDQNKETLERIKKRIQELTNNLKNFQKGTMIAVAKKQMDKVKTACVMGLLKLESIYNKDGNNWTYKYQDIKDEYVKSFIGKIKEAQSQLSLITACLEDTKKIVKKESFPN